jgi:DNA-binding transcriptional ArsR family regulator
MAKSRKQRNDTETQLKALAHETRLAIMAVFVGKGADTPVSPREVSGVLRQPLANVSYHVRVLADCEAIRLVYTKPVGGSMQHFYRPSATFIALPWVANVLGLDATAEAA